MEKKKQFKKIKKIFNKRLLLKSEQIIPSSKSYKRRAKHKKRGDYEE